MRRFFRKWTTKKEEAGGSGNIIVSGRSVESLFFEKRVLSFSTTVTLKPGTILARSITDTTYTLV